ncbi:hypothetical protein F2Q69_00048077 [Brassica cretica]|uniref:Ubiquitin-like protease family profile domain-containing protein n=1 Tax=Brassica cretica TaxID=69181 RepID=A0A8S9PVJ8_BRACR|nr:hypothetical protein F2Q69_00048077 [Brassica cretica]
MLDANGETNVAAEYEWSDDEDDVGVSNMLNLIDQRYGFNSQCFVGGSMKQEVNKMWEGGKAELVGRKTVKTKTSSSSHGQEGVDIDLLASLVSEKLKEDFHLLHGAISTIQESANAFTETILENISEVFCTVQDSVHQIATLSADIRKLAATVPVSPPDMANNRPNVVDADTQTVPDVPTIISDAIDFAKRSTQSAAAGGQNASNANTTVGGVTDNSGQPGLEADHSAPQCCQQEHVGPQPSDAQVNLTLDPALLFPNPTFSLGLTQEARLERLNHANVTINTDHKGVDEDHEEASMEETPPTFETATQLSPQVVDVLMLHTSALFWSQSSSKKIPICVFMDTQFVSQFTKLYTKFSKVSRKDSFKFTADVVDMFLQLPSYADAVRFYFPFFVDKKYWVAICVDCSSWTVTVLDCNTALRTDYMMTKDVRPIASMFPYLLKQVGREFGTRDGKVMGFERPRTIPQQIAVTHSAVSSVLLIQAHALGGVDAYKCITPDVLDSQVERLVVTLYESTVGAL